MRRAGRSRSSSGRTRLWPASTLTFYAAVKAIWVASSAALAASTAAGSGAAAAIARARGAAASRAAGGGAGNAAYGEDAAPTVPVSAGGRMRLPLSTGTAGRGT